MKTLLKIAFFLLALLAGGWQALAQMSETSPGKYFIFKNYTTQNGLLANDMYAMAQDKSGYIWIASSLGLTRFDGKTFFHKAIPEIYDNPTVVTYFETTPEGDMITSSYMQGVFVQQDDGRFEQFLEGETVEIGRNMFKAVKYCPDSSILACVSRSLYRIKDGAMVQLYDYGSVFNIFNTLELDKDNRIWFGGRLGLGILQPSETGYEPVIFPELKNQFIGKILFDDEGTLHVATVQGYYRIKWHQPYRWDTDYTIEQPFPQLEKIYINQLYIDQERNLWIPTDSYGILRTKGDSITLHLTQENGLSSSSVNCMIQDKEGNYWFATINGLCMAKDFDNFAIANNGVLFKDAANITVDEFQRIWIFSRSAIYVYQDDKLIPLNLNGTPFEIAGIRLLEIYNSEVLISNDIGLFRLPISKSLPDMRKIEQVADYSKYKVPGLLHSLRTDSEGVWICAMTKLCNYFNGQFLPVTFNHADSITLSPRRMISDNYGYYWCGDYGYGLYRGVVSRPDKNRIVFDDITAYKSRNPDSAFVTTQIRDIALDREGNLWVSSLYSGVYKLIIDSNGVVSSKLYSTADGLLTNNVYGITFDDEGRVWFLTQRGVSILSRDSLGVESINKFDVNPKMEGIFSSPLQIGDRLYLLTDEGIFITQAQFYKEKAEPTPEVLITNLLINGITDSKISAHSDNFHLAPEQNNLTVEYSAITYRNADNVRYQYKLEGADNDWSVLSDRSFVEFATLNPGKYTFKVRAAMVGGHAETGKETSLSFRVLAPYYRTIWFYCLITIAIASLLYTFYRYRLNQVIKMARMRTRIASDLHDDIGSTLSSISLISEMASQTDKESILAMALKKIGVDSRDVLNSMDDIIWSVNPHNDSLFNLTVRLREYAIPVCESQNITFSMQIDETIYALILGMEERRNVFLIIKEAVNNAVKHAGCALLSIAFVLRHKQLEIKITDDGCGFDPAKRGLRNGMTNMERRAKQIGAELNIHSEKGAGSTITLKIKNI